MARAILGGMVFGGGVSLVAAAVISVVLDPPTKPEVTDLAPRVTAAPAPPDSQAASEFREADLVREGNAVAPVSAPSPEDADAAALAGRDTPRVPEAGDASGFGSVSDGAEVAGIDLPTDEPVLPAPQGALPGAPTVVEELSISTDPAQPLPPEVEDPLNDVAPDQLAAPDAPVAPELTGTQAPVTTERAEVDGPDQSQAEAPGQPDGDASPEADVASAPLPPARNDAAAVDAPSEAAQTDSPSDATVATDTAPADVPAGEDSTETGATFAGEPLAPDTNTTRSADAVEPEPADATGPVTASTTPIEPDTSSATVADATTPVAPNVPGSTPAPAAAADAVREAAGTVTADAITPETTTADAAPEGTSTATEDATALATTESSETATTETGDIVTAELSDATSAPNSAPDMSAATSEPVQPQAPGVAVPQPTGDASVADPLAAEVGPSVATAEPVVPQTPDVPAANGLVTGDDADAPSDTVIAQAGDGVTSLATPQAPDSAASPAPEPDAPRQAAVAEDTESDPARADSGAGAQADVSQQPVTPDATPKPPETVTIAPETATPGRRSEEVAQADLPGSAPVPSSQQPATARPSVGRPARSLFDRDPDPEPAEAASPAPQPGSDNAGPALKRYAAAFEAGTGKPLMSVVLIDPGIDVAAPKTGLGALSGLPYPITFAINASLPDAAERMDAYRAAGFEVVALMDLPLGANVQDAAVNIDVTLDILPRSVAIIEGPVTGLQENPDIGDLLFDALNKTGHGLVLQTRGLNTAVRDARQSGLAARTIFRDFDKAGQDARAIRRFFDQAAFRAGQEGGVIMLGRLRAETIAALEVWSGQPRAERVTLAPLSAILQAQ